MTSTPCRQESAGQLPNLLLPPTTSVHLTPKSLGSWEMLEEGQIPVLNHPRCRHTPCTGEWSSFGFLTWQLIWGISRLSVTPGAPGSPTRAVSSGIPIVTSKVTLTWRVCCTQQCSETCGSSLSSASVTSQKPWMEGRLCVQRGSLDWEQVVSQLWPTFVLGWSLEGRACVEGRAGKVCTLGGWGAWGHGQGEDVPCHPQTFSHV